VFYFSSRFLLQAISVNILETFMYLQDTRHVMHPLRAEGLQRVALVQGQPLLEGPTAPGLDQRLVVGPGCPWRGALRPFLLAGLLRHRGLVRKSFLSCEITLTVGFLGWDSKVAPQ